MPIKQFRDAEGCFSYLIYCEQEKVAAVVDPNHDPNLYLSAIKNLGLSLIYAVDTHTHVDHDSLSGELAKITGAKVLMHPAYVEQRKLGAAFTGNKTIENHLANNSVIQVDITPQDMEIITLGKVEIKVLYTPGHTLDSFSLVVDNKILTGDILMIGSCGRSDFPGGNNEDMYNSLYSKLVPLGEDYIIYPAHDYNHNINSVLGFELVNNPFLRHSSKQEFIKFAEASFAKLPSFSSGDKIQCALTPASPEPVPSQPAPPTTTSPLMGQMCSAMEYYFKNIPQHWNLVNSNEMLEIIAKENKDILILDVRQPDEYKEGHIPGAINLPVRELPIKVKELPTNLQIPIITVCHSGSRSAYAAMFLRGYGYSHVRSLDLGMHQWKELNFPITA